MHFDSKLYQPYTMAVKVIVTLTLFWLSSDALAQALSTTFVGLQNRTINFTPAKGDGIATGEIGTESDDQAKTESINGPTICERISGATSLGLEIGAGGCIQSGGIWTFSSSMSAFGHLIYYPLAARSEVKDDMSINMRREYLGDFYILGHGGFAKITHSQTSTTPVTMSMDLIEFGLGIGWSYRIGTRLSVGVEGSYLVGSILSSAATGSANALQALGSFTVYL